MAYPSRYTVVLATNLGQYSVTVSPALFPAGMVFVTAIASRTTSTAPSAALTGAGVTLRALNATAGTGGAGNRDTLGETFAASNATS